MINMGDHVGINTETPRIDGGCSFEKEFTKLIYMNHQIILYLIVNQVDLFHDCVCGPLT